jgi:chemotaxis protein methyltransferase CheR
MDASTFRAYQQIARAKAGIDIRPGKESLISARVGSRMRQLGLKTERQYLDHLKSDPTGEELILFLDAIATNFTSFFREPDHFDKMREQVRRLLDQGQRRFRFWCAASSSGEEPYSLALALADLLEGKDWRILATDISTRVLAVAERAIYPKARIKPVPPYLAMRYLEPAGLLGEEELFRVRAELRARVVFRRLNLAEPPFPMQGPLDAVLCRNVMIYFDLPVRQALVAEVDRLLRPGAPFIVGHSETLNGIRTRLEAERPSVYILPESEARSRGARP